jgi:hypothetical protein
LLLAGPLVALLAGAGVLPPGLVLLRGPVPVLVAALLALLAAQAAGLVAVYRAGQVRPAEALREVAAPPRRLPILRTATGLLVATLGVGLALRPLATGAEVGIMERSPRWRCWWPPSRCSVRHWPGWVPTCWAAPSAASAGHPGAWPWQSRAATLAAWLPPWSPLRWCSR